MTEALVTPAVIEWARARHNLTIDELSRKVQVKSSRLEEWEVGRSRPTFRQAQKLAERLYIPFGYLFLSEPPKFEFSIPDLRTVSGERLRNPSPDFQDLLNDVIAKQEWYREFLELEEAQPIPLIGKFSIDNDPDDIARDIRTTLAINDRTRLAARSWEEFLRDVVRRVEDVGILVMRSGIVGSNTHRPLSVEEFRGFVIADEIAPLVFINSKDAKSAQIFTLFHELVHLWIGEGGISNPIYREKSSGQINGVERLCNRVAAEVLLPKVEFNSRWQDGVPLELNLRKISSRFRVSKITVLRQALDQEKISGEIYWSYFQSEVDKYERTLAQSEGGDFYNTFTARNSTVFTLALIEATSEGRTTRREAARLLSVRVGTLDSVMDRFLGKGSQDA